METKNDKALKFHLTDLLTQANAHVTFDQSVENLQTELTGIRPEKLPYSIWQLIEHIRITQWDILEFSKDARHQSPKWPDEYWPKEVSPAGEKALASSIKSITENREEFIGLIKAADANLFEPFAHGSGQNLLREALLIADHTAYHTGQIIVVRRLLGNWDG